MNISYNWLKSFVDFDMTPAELSVLLTDIGLEVGKMYEYESIKGGLRGVVVGEVLQCKKHPNADRLSVTEVDLGDGEVVQIVCGAPNVAAGQKVLVAKVGAVLYGADGSSFMIKKAKIRGERSQGMICAEDELGLGSDHSGILVLDQACRVGAAASEYFEVDRDYIFEIDLTPNRSDATSHYGVARDVLAALKVRNKSSLEIKEAELPAIKFGEDKSFGVRVMNPEACARYAGLTLSGVEVKASPGWLQTRLRSIGVRPINNIVDITNFVLHEYGQPLHAFDADRITSGEIVVRFLAEGTVFRGLDGQDRSLSAEDLMVCDGEKPMCMAGVFGGDESGVKEHTRRIFLESAHFSPKFVRRTSMRHNLRTDSAKVFEKTSNPENCVKALLRAADLICRYAGGRVSSELVDIKTQEIARKRVRLSLSKLRSLAGYAFSKAELLEVLSALDMSVQTIDEDSYEVAIPMDKSDVLREVDVIEEVLRIFGYNRIPVADEICYAPGLKTESFFARKENLAVTLKGMGFLECMALSLVPNSTPVDVLGLSSKQLVRINNTSNIHLDTMRPSILFSALESIRYNLARRQMDLKLFEIGKEYQRAEEGILEREVLGIWMTGNQSQSNWLEKSPKPFDFYALKSVVHSLLAQTGVQGYDEKRSVQAGFSYASLVTVAGDEICRYGEVSKSLCMQYDINRPVYYARIDIERLYENRCEKPEYKAISRYPSVYRDLAIKLDSDRIYGEVESVIRQSAKSRLQSIRLFDVYQDEALEREGKKSMAVRLELSDQNKTLEEKEIDGIVNRILKQLKKELGATLR